MKPIWYRFDVLPKPWTHGYILNDHPLRTPLFCTNASIARRNVGSTPMKFCIVDSWNWNNMRDENEVLHGGGPPMNRTGKDSEYSTFFGLIFKKAWFPCWTCKIHLHHHCNSGYLERVSGENTNPHKVFGALTGTFFLIKFQPLL